MSSVEAAYDGHRLVSETLAFGPVSFTYRTLARDELMVRKDDITGLMPWHSGHLLAQLLASRPHLLAGANVVELGCGAGLLGAVSAAVGAREVVLTDAVSSVLPLAILNTNEAAATAAGRRACSISSCELRWGDAEQEARALASLSHDCSDERFHVGIASEVFYIHRNDDSSPIASQAAALFGCCAPLFKYNPDNVHCPYEGQRAGDGTGFDSTASCGLLLLVYKPRYRGMAQAIRAAATSTRTHIAPLNKDAVMTESQAASLRFGSTRLLAASPCASCLRRFLADEGLQCGSPDADDDDDDDDDDRFCQAEDASSALAAFGSGVCDE